jgi:hypothetical protein
MAARGRSGPAGRGARDLGRVDPGQWLPALEPLLTGTATDQVLWDRVLQRQTLTESDSAFLYELVRKKEGDKLNAVRELLFDGLYQVTERRPTATIGR